MVQNKIKTVIASAFVLGLVAVGAQGAFADQIQTTSANGVMQNRHADMEANMQAKTATRIKDAVTAGKLTQAKADLITAKIAELQASRQNAQSANKNLTPEQRKANMTAQKTALDAWATANGLSKDDLKFLVPGGRGPGMKGFGNKGEHGSHKGFGHKATSTSSTTTQ